MSIPSNFSLFFYDKILAIIISIPPTFPALMPFPELLQIFGHWREKGGVWEGSVRSEAEEKKMQFSYLICSIGAYILGFCQQFTENPLFISNKNISYYYVYSSLLSIILLW